MLTLRASTPFTTALLLAVNIRAARGGHGGGNVLNELPDCWDSCSKQVSQSDCSWYQTDCICDLANETSYLADTITCAKQTCDNFSSSQSDRFLSPIEFSCSLFSGGLSQSRLNDAQAAAEAPAHTSQSSQSPTATETHQHSTTQQPSTSETTLKATTTNSQGSTAVINQPVSYGPSGVSSGERSTSALKSTVNIVPVPASSSKITLSSDSLSTTTAGGLLLDGGTPTPGSGSDSTSSSSSSSSSATATSEPGGGGTLFDSQGGAESLVSSRSWTLPVLGLASFLFAILL